MRVISSILLPALLFGATTLGFADVAPAPLLETARGDLTGGRADHGLDVLNQVLAQEPQNAEAHNLLCRIYMQEQRWSDAIKSCQAAVKLMPDNSSYHLWLARAL